MFGSSHVFASRCRFMLGSACLRALSEYLSLAYLSAVFSASACTATTLRSLLPNPSTAAAIKLSDAHLTLGSPLRRRQAQPPLKRQTQAASHEEAM